jgi:hypothetical protein
LTPAVFNADMRSACASEVADMLSKIQVSTDDPSTEPFTEPEAQKALDELISDLFKTRDPSLLERALIERSTSTPCLLRHRLAQLKNEPSPPAPLGPLPEARGVVRMAASTGTQAQPQPPKPEGAPPHEPCSPGVTPDQASAKLDEAFKSLRRQYPLRASFNSRAAHQYGYFVMEEALKALETYKDCLDPTEYAADHDRMISTRDAARQGCAELASDNACAPEYPKE